MKKIGRNSKCPCGSGKKYKHCCMKKMSVDEVIILYYRQSQLAKKEDIDEKDCHNIIDIGNKILNANINIKCITGTYVNMALAKEWLYYLKNDMNDLMQAEQYYKEALKIKPNNQVAIRHGFGICLELKKYNEA